MPSDAIVDDTMYNIITTQNYQSQLVWVAIQYRIVQISLGTDKEYVNVSPYYSCEFTR